MPRPALPPTPGSSTDIRGKTQLTSLAPALSLGPAAYGDAPLDRASTSSTPSANGSDSSYRPHSPHSPPSKRKASVSQSKSIKANNGEFTLPPPPSRSRKIIQMKPGTKANEEQDDQKQSAVVAQDIATGRGGRKRGNATGQTAAGRKIARKTAHSLIERRRRSKMNEEFGVLKDMVPACNGQEMHKLAILQASIDYLRYLERCITDLKSANESHTSHAQTPYPTARPDDVNDEEMDEDSEDDDASTHDHDEEMSDTHPPSAIAARAYPATSQPLRPSTSHPHTTTLPSIHTLTTIPPPSPSVSAPTYHRPSISSTNAPYSPYTCPPSSHPSPLFSPLTTGMTTEVQRFSLASPALGPVDRRRGSVETAQGQRDRERSDREAMAALLMLNEDRRGRERGSGTGAGMSVRDLLSH